MSFTKSGTPKKVNYLNNKDILDEIYKSKLTFSSFTDPIYKEYDLIVPSLAAITEEALVELKSALGGANFEMIKSATEKVATVSQALGTALYASAAAASEQGAPADDGVEDAEIVEEQK